MSFAAYLLFTIAVLGAAARFGAHRIVWPALFLGLVWLPPLLLPGQWPDEAWRVPGGGLPTPFALGAALVVPIVVLSASLTFNRDQPPFQWGLADTAMALFCLWPLLQALLFRPSASPPGWLSAAYLSGSWGALWLIGRRHLVTPGDVPACASALVLSALSIAPLAMFETVTENRIYEEIFGFHPFAQVGQHRWIGNRPLLFFEDGNQYGLWIACAALGGLWLARYSQPCRRTMLMAGVLLVIAIASQSLGAIVLLAVAAIVLLAPTWRRLLAIVLLPIAAASAIVIALSITGAINLRVLVLGNPLGRAIYDVLREIGRGSFAWRFGQDDKTFPAIRDQLVWGTGQWDWFAAFGTRPWGFPQLLLGQFGMAGLGALGMCGLFVAYRFLRHQASGQDREAILFLSLLIAMATGDAVLNNFLFYPAIALAGGIFSICALNAGVCFPRGSVGKTH